MPSRTDVPEYAEYLEKIEALVAVVNHRHGTPDWMPIDLKLRDDLDEAVASYKHYDVMMVNAMFDGMNLVAKEGPLVNERHGVSILSENTGAHEELGEFALSREPVRRPGARRRDLLGAGDVAGGARAPRRRPEGDRHVARSGRLDRRADRGHPRQARDRVARGGRLSARSRTRRSARRARRARRPAARPARPRGDRSGALGPPRRRAARPPRARAARPARRARSRCSSAARAARASPPALRAARAASRRAAPARRRRRLAAGPRVSPRSRRRASLRAALPRRRGSALDSARALARRPRPAAAADAGRLAVGDGDERPHDDAGQRGERPRRPGRRCPSALAGRCRDPRSS